jgi:hypothetical protein
MNKDEDSVQRPWLTTRALMQGLQMAHELVNHFFEVGHLMNRFLIFNCEKEAVMASYKEVYKDMQKMAEQSKITSLLSLLSLLCYSLYIT